MKMEIFYIRIAALVLALISALVLRADLMLREYFICYFAMVFNILFSAEFMYIAVRGESPTLRIFIKFEKAAGHIFNVMIALNVMAALFFLFWSLSFPLRTYAVADITITLIQGFFLAAVCVALSVNHRYYRENLHARFLNLLQISAINYTVCVFMMARLLQGTILMPWQVLLYGMANIVLAVLAMVVMNPSGNIEK